MFVGTIPLVWRLGIMFLAGVGAGIANGIAGGGTFITFPTMLSLGVPALTANISTTVGVVPSYIGSLRVFRVQLRPHKKLIMSLLPSCVLGSALGTALLLGGSPSTFREVVPWLIGVGTVLFAISPYVTRSLAHVDSEHRGRRWALYIGIFVVSIYGGYFGAGIGILLLAVHGPGTAVRDLRVAGSSQRRVHGDQRRGRLDLRRLRTLGRDSTSSCCCWGR